ncbi:AzlD domain-containing protein [Sulfobacillus harzensis]|uniref:AzlD domain-containing protein n=1 Tax=Sulfobacillus harzensis TaxID=2729629 RepID=A0A7Y0Q2D8_9FIRM|nr:AzlD domain-containing protein [Sulfobacillus harzensis]NMP22382.1 AzlD domain-containing protein [Sulfobacillus harzensis]
MPWSWLVIVGALGYAQRSLPWMLASRHPLPKAVVQWLRFVAPAAFATLMVEDLAHFTVPAMAAIVAAGLISWRTRNLGFAVVGALVVSVGLQALGLS